MRVLARVLLGLRLAAPRLVLVRAAPLKSLDGSDTVVRARSVAGDRLLPTSKWHLHNWRPGPDDFAFFPEKEHLDVHRLAPAVLVGEL